MKREKKTTICSMIFIAIAVVIVVTGIVYQTCKKKTAVQEVFFSDSISVQKEVLHSEIPENQNGAQENFDASAGSEPQVTAQTVEGKETVSRNCCYVCGAVKNPGVYDFSDGARLEEVIALAGGFTEDAATDYLNLAETVSDSEKVYVPTEKEVETQFVTNVETSAGMKQAREDAKDKVNINTADIEKLTTLPGIGEAKANSILAYREEHGGFQSIEELKDIDGIKDGVYNKVKDLIVVQ